MLNQMKTAIFEIRISVVGMKLKYFNSSYVQNAMKFVCMYEIWGENVHSRLRTVWPPM